MNRDQAASFLGVSTQASPEEIEAAYRARALVMHPDKQTQGSPAHAAAQDMMRDLNEARRVMQASVSEPMTDRGPKSSTTEGDEGADFPLIPIPGNLAPPSARAIPGQFVVLESGDVFFVSDALNAQGTYAFTQIIPQANVSGKIGVGGRIPLAAGWYMLFGTKDRAHFFLNTMMMLDMTYGEDGAPPPSPPPGSQTHPNAEYAVPRRPASNSKAPRRTTWQKISLGLFIFVIIGQVGRAVSSAGDSGNTGQPEAARHVVGSCWAPDSGDMYKHVSCDSGGSVEIVYATLRSSTDCMGGYFANRDGTYACLRPYSG